MEAGEGRGRVGGGGGGRRGGEGRKGRNVMDMDPYLNKGRNIGKTRS